MGLAVRGRSEKPVTNSCSSNTTEGQRSMELTGHRHPLENTAQLPEKSSFGWTEHRDLLKQGPSILGKARLPTAPTIPDLLLPFLPGRHHHQEVVLKQIQDLKTCGQAS